MSTIDHTKSEGAVLPPVSIAAPGPSTPEQQQLFPRRAVIEYPPTEVSADSLGEAEADDGHRYYIKGDAQNKRVRASEWLGTHISEAIGIGAPSAAVIQRLGGDTVFGSRRIAGVADALTTQAYLTTPSTANNSVQIPGLSPILSGIYSLDLFLNNEDRHFGNYLTIDDNGRRRLYAFDFSRAIFWAGIDGPIPPLVCNTVMCGRFLRRLHGFDAVAATTTLDRLGALASDVLSGFLNTMPADWLPTADRHMLVDWWAGGQRHARISQLKKGINDGTCL